MDSSITEHYRLYYQYNLPSSQQPGDVVNGLFDRVMRNDKKAASEVIKILSSNTFYLVVKRLRACGINDMDSVDDLMQDIRVEVLRQAFRGFPAKVTQEGFFGYLLSMVEICCRNYRRRIFKEGKSLLKDLEDKNEFVSAHAAEENENENALADSPEVIIFNNEQLKVYRNILDFYIEALKETAEPPYQVLTYCYAILIPQLIKRTHNEKLLRMVNQLSSRDGKQVSCYNEEKGCLEGEITRKSINMINWAISAMSGQRADALGQEVIEIYGMEPLTLGKFEWGSSYEQNMEKIYDGEVMREIILTNKYATVRMKNWPPRIAQKLMEATRNKAMKDLDFRRRSKETAEDIFGR